MLLEPTVTLFRIRHDAPNPHLLFTADRFRHGIILLRLHALVQNILRIPLSQRGLLFVVLLIPYNIKNKPSIIVLKTNLFKSKGD